MKRVNMVYTFQIPENTTQLPHADWVDVVLYSLDNFLYPLLSINNTTPKPVVPEHLVNVFEKDDPEFTKECDGVISEILSTTPNLYRHIAAWVMDREMNYDINPTYRVIGQQWVKLYLAVSPVEIRMTYV